MTYSNDQRRLTQDNKCIVCINSHIGQPNNAIYGGSRKNDYINNQVSTDWSATPDLYNNGIEFSAKGRTTVDSTVLPRFHSFYKSDQVFEKGQFSPTSNLGFIEPVKNEMGSLRSNKNPIVLSRLTASETNKRTRDDRLIYQSNKLQVVTDTNLCSAESNQPNVIYFDADTLTPSMFLKDQRVKRNGPSTKSVCNSNNFSERNTPYNKSSHVLDFSSALSPRRFHSSSSYISHNSGKMNKSVSSPFDTSYLQDHHFQDYYLTKVHETDRASIDLPYNKADYFKNNSKHIKSRRSKELCEESYRSDRTQINHSVDINDFVHQTKVPSKDLKKQSVDSNFAVPKRDYFYYQNNELVGNKSIIDRIASLPYITPTQSTDLNKPINDNNSTDRYTNLGYIISEAPNKTKKNNLSRVKNQSKLSYTKLVSESNTSTTSQDPVSDHYFKQNQSIMVRTSGEPSKKYDELLNHSESGKGSIKTVNVKPEKNYPLYVKVTKPTIENRHNKLKLNKKVFCNSCHTAITSEPKILEKPSHENINDSNMTNTENLSSSERSERSLKDLLKISTLDFIENKVTKYLDSNYIKNEYINLVSKDEKVDFIRKTKHEKRKKRFKMLAKAMQTVVSDVIASHKNLSSNSDQMTSTGKFESSNNADIKDNRRFIYNTENDKNCTVRNEHPNLINKSNSNRHLVQHHSIDSASTIIVIPSPLSGPLNSKHQPTKKLTSTNLSIQSYDTHYSNSYDDTEYEYSDTSLESEYIPKFHQIFKVPEEGNDFKKHESFPSSIFIQPGVKSFVSDDFNCPENLACQASETSEQQFLYQSSIDTCDMSQHQFNSVEELSTLNKPNILTVEQINPLAYTSVQTIPKLLEFQGYATSSEDSLKLTFNNTDSYRQTSLEKEETIKYDVHRNMHQVEKKFASQKKRDFDVDYEYGETRERLKENTIDSATFNDILSGITSSDLSRDLDLTKNRGSCQNKYKDVSSSSKTSCPNSIFKSQTQNEAFSMLLDIFDISLEKATNHLNRKEQSYKTIRRRSSECRCVHSPYNHCNSRSISKPPISKTRLGKLWNTICLGRKVYNYSFLDHAISEKRDLNIYLQSSKVKDPDIYQKYYSNEFTIESDSSQITLKVPYVSSNSVTQNYSHVDERISFDTYNVSLSKKSKNQFKGCEYNKNSLLNVDNSTVLNNISPSEYSSLFDKTIITNQQSSNIVFSSNRGSTHLNQENPFCNVKDCTDENHQDIKKIYSNEQLQPSTFSPRNSYSIKINQYNEKKAVQFSKPGSFHKIVDLLPDYQVNTSKNSIDDTIISIKDVLPTVEYNSESGDRSGYVSNISSKISNLKAFDIKVKDTDFEPSNANSCEEGYQTLKKIYNTTDCSDNESFLSCSEVKEEDCSLSNPLSEAPRGVTLDFRLELKVSSVGAQTTIQSSNNITNINLFTPKNAIDNVMNWIKEFAASLDNIISA